MTAHQSVIDAWPKFSASKEGYVLCMYVDKFNYVTTGVGNLIDSPEAALALPWRHKKDGRFATSDEVRAEWNRLKHHPGLVRAQRTVPLRDLAWTQYDHLLDLTLTPEDVDQLVWNKREEFYNYLKRKFFSQLDTYPADAQMAMLSIAWAVGPAWPLKFANLTNAILRGDWGTYNPKMPYDKHPQGQTGAVACAKIRDGLDTPSKLDDNVGVVPRNKANFALLHNAGVVVANGLDPSKLYYPELLQRDSKSTRKDREEVVVTPQDVGDAAALFKLAEEAVDLSRRERNEQLKEK